MIGSVWHVAAAAAFLLISHFWPTSRTVRERIVARIGAGAFRGLYSAVSLVALVWLVMAFNAAPLIWWMEPVPALAWVPLLTMPVAMILVVGGYTQMSPNAITVRQDAPIAEPRGLLRVTRNPLMWGVGIWAVGHAVANTDLASLFLFGGLAMLALVGSARLDAKTSRRRGAAWDAFAAQTSNVPFLAILTGRQRFEWQEIGVWRILAGLVLYAILLYLHPSLFGVGAAPGA